MKVLSPLGSLPTSPLDLPALTLTRLTSQRLVGSAQFARLDRKTSMPLKLLSLGTRLFAADW